ncbi:S41 family peptidase [soil metagenome]
MSEVKNSLVTAGIIIAASVAVVAGTVMRGSIDLGSSSGSVRVAGNQSEYLASNQNGVDVPAADYFYELSEKLKKEYVEPVKDDQVLASGAVRGMVTSLGDPKSIFYSKEEFTAFLNARQGQYSGIGVDTALVFPDATAPKKKPQSDGESSETSAEEALALGFQIPKVVVSNVVPGGPADKAGVLPGDVVYEIDNHWVANVQEVAEFRAAQVKFLQKKITKDQYAPLRNDIRKKTERALMPTKVRERLSLGVAGPIDVIWLRNGKQRDTKMDRGPSTLPPFSVAGDTIRLPFTSGSDADLSKAILGKNAITIDLRNNVNGDFDVMRKCLAVVAKTGKYGSLETERKDKSLFLTVSKGNLTPPKISLLVDQTTSGSALIFAKALSTFGGATLSSPKTGADYAVKEIVQLPDGSGYSLVTGIYRPVNKETMLAQGGKS